MMKFVRAAVTLVFVAVAVLFSYIFYNENIKADKTYPTITVGDEILKVKNDVSDEELLEGVTAYDEKDGDISDKVIIESISKFTEKGVCNVTYAVCDNDRHVARAVRKIKYENYKSPRFYLNEPLCYSVNRYVNIDGVIGAKDDIDGDISSNVIVMTEYFESGTVGTFTINAKATNSKGDTIEIKLPLIVEDRSVNAPEIKLSSYLIYVKKGSKVNFMKYVKSVKSYTDDENDIPVTVSTEFDKNKTGVYSVHYYATDELQRRGHSVLTVIVE